ncbi:hypothetical protein [Spirosoma luteolum]
MRTEHLKGLNKQSGTRIFLSVLAFSLLFTIGYLFNKTIVADRKIFQLNFVALLLGLTFEYKRIVKQWTTVLWTAFTAFIFSFFGFVQYKGEKTYSFIDHLERWPYFFLGFFIVFATIVYVEEGPKKITEGITLLMTISFNYWFIATGHWKSDHILMKGFLLLNLLLSGFSVFNSLSYRALNSNTRLLLSIWTALLTLVLATDNILKLYKLRDIEHSTNLDSAILVFLKFFFLGISSIYIAQNIALIGAYFPGKGFVENSRDINKKHVDRFSNDQVYIGESIIIIFISCSVYTLNYLINFASVNFTIWMNIALAPVLLFLIHKFLR